MINILEESGFEDWAENDDANFETIPITLNDKDLNLNLEDLPEHLPILPLRNTVLFPLMALPVSIGRVKSNKLIKDAKKNKSYILVVAQQNVNAEEPLLEDLYKIGTLAKVLKIIKLPNNQETVFLQGIKQVTLKSISKSEPYLVGSYSVNDQIDDSTANETKDLLKTIKSVSADIMKLQGSFSTELINGVKRIDNPFLLMALVATNLNVDLPAKQKILDNDCVSKMAIVLLEQMMAEKELLKLKNKIQDKVRGDLDKQQREFFLHQQIKAINEELGSESPEKEIETLIAKGKEKKWKPEVEEAFNKEIERLRRINPMAPDYSIQINYLNTLLDLPWDETTTDNFDLKRAEEILNEDHFGLEKVKKRILEYLAVLKLKGDMKSPILCLYGPPGVGKTSLGKSIAKALDRKYARISLGGLHDESEVRGHRRTYIGAMPGRIIQNLKKVKSNNPVFVLDEIDKIQTSFRGDPSSALLEVLDPEQNGTFYDNFIEIDYDLSNVMFVATANNLDSIQPALLDRMEIIEINGYTLEEKIEIAKKYLIPKQEKNHGLKLNSFEISNQVLEKVIDGYTRESGVRGLEKQIAAIARHVAMQKVMFKKNKKTFSIDDLQEILGVERGEKEMYQGNDVAGVVTGLAWTSVGGEILFIESSLTQGNGKLQLTGQLGDVMKESALTALTFLKSHCEYLGINPKVFNQFDIHIHVPAGAVPKDGPSAGVTMLTSLASLFTQRKVKPQLAMTGEITLRGKVLPIGGVKEKILAAKRAGINTILLCEINRKDVEEINKTYLNDITFHYVKNMLDVIDFALLNEKVENPVNMEIVEVKPII
ncbi:MAG: endopeptidase La [Bacteroidota bacterium]|jgi:ATP-dependent Lon protease